MSSRVQGQGSGFSVRVRIVSRSPLAGLAYVLCLSLLACHVSATELQWRRGGPKHSKPSADSQPIAKANSFVKPAPRRDGAVRAVAFEDDGRAEFDGPSFAAKQAGGAPLRSVLVDGEASSAESGVVREAQLQFQPPSDAGDRYNSQITQPFGQPPVEAESTQVEVDEQEEMTLPAESMPDMGAVAPPAAIERQPAGAERQPRTFQPAPSRNAPKPDPFATGDDEPNAGLPNTEDPLLSDEGREARAYCSEELARLKAHTLDQVDLSISVSGKQGQDYPVECTIDAGRALRWPLLG